MERKSKIGAISKFVGSNDIDTKYTHNSMTDVLTVALCLGLFPLTGLRSTHPKKVKFEWLSLKFLYSVVLLFSYIFCFGVSASETFVNELFMHRLTAPLFYLHVTGTKLIFWKMAYKWPEFINSIRMEETGFLNKYKHKTNIRPKINMTMITAGIIVVLEHVFAVVNFMYSDDCENDAKGFENYARKQFHFMFNNFPYHIFWGILLLVSSLIATAVWNFGDLFIIIWIIILTIRFNEIKDKIVCYVKSLASPNTMITKGSQRKQENMDLLFWKDIRQDYDKLCRLCTSVNALLANIILLSYSFNLCFILIKLFISVRERDRLIETIYYFTSLGFIMVRTIMVSIYGGWLQEASKAVLPILNDIPTNIYNPEIARLINQIHTTSPSLTCHNLFSITKGLVLSVAASTITYELVIIQMNQSLLEKYMSRSNITNCH